MSGAARAAFGDWSRWRADRNFGSNTGMDKPNDTEQRLMELEVKASFTEDLLDQLDQVIVRQQEQIDQLVRELARLRQQPGDAGSGGPRAASDDLPPHY